MSKYYPLGATYLTLCRSLVRLKGNYLLKDNVKENRYYKVKNVASTQTMLDGTAYLEVLSRASEGSKLISIGWSRLDAYKDDEGYSMFNSGVFDEDIRLPIDGTCPTIVSKEEAIAGTY